MAFGLVGVAALVGLGVRSTLGRDGGDATATSTAPAVNATAPPVAAVATPSTTGAPATTTPSIDSLAACGGSSTATARCPPAMCHPTSSRPTCRSNRTQVPPSSQRRLRRHSRRWCPTPPRRISCSSTAVTDPNSNSNALRPLRRGLRPGGRRPAGGAPGTSEHQTGLAGDVGLVGLPDDQLFGDTEASVWVAENARRFGFVLRYPPDKAEITGYNNEPWHLRYVGRRARHRASPDGLTMEEYFGLSRRRRRAELCGRSGAHPMPRTGSIA